MTSTIACCIASRKLGVPVAQVKGVIIDSDGITEETTVLGIPCLTPRDNTERPETITIGTNELIGSDPRKLPPALARLMVGQWEKGAIPPNGTASRQSVSSRLLKNCWWAHEPTSPIPKSKRVALLSHLAKE